MEEAEIGLLGPLHQPPAPREDAAAPHGQGHRNQEAQGGTALPAIQPGKGHPAQGRHGAGLHALDRELAA